MTFAKLNFPTTHSSVERTVRKYTCFSFQNNYSRHLRHNGYPSMRDREWRHVTKTVESPSFRERRTSFSGRHMKRGCGLGKRNEANSHFENYNAAHEVHQNDSDIIIRIILLWVTLPHASGTLILFPCPLVSRSFHKKVSSLALLSKTRSLWLGRTGNPPSKLAPL